MFTPRMLTFYDDGSFQTIWHGCTGTIWEDEDEYLREGEKIILRPRGHSETYHRVKWGERLYLLHGKQFIMFCNAINQGYEPNRSGSIFYLRTGDEKRPAAGDPDIPPEWLDYLLDEPVEGKVLDVQIDKIVLDAGRDKGLKVGMEVVVEGEDGRESKFRIVSVSGTTSVAAFSSGDMRVVMGDRFSTRVLVDLPLEIEEGDEGKTGRSP
jgi:hypothetical protein